MKFLSRILSFIRRYQARAKIAKELAKIAMTTPEWNTRALTHKVLRYQDSVRHDPTAGHANFYLGLLDNCAEQHINFEVSKKECDIKFKMEG